jgi:hypothetical protein
MKTGKTLLQARESIYLMRNGNFKNTQIMPDIYIMGIEASLNKSNADESFFE